MTNRAPGQLVLLLLQSSAVSSLPRAKAEPAGSELSRLSALSSWPTKNNQPALPRALALWQASLAPNLPHAAAPLPRLSQSPHLEHACSILASARLAQTHQQNSPYRTSHVAQYPGSSSARHQRHSRLTTPLSHLHLLLCHRDKQRQTRRTSWRP